MAGQAAAAAPPPALPASPERIITNLLLQVILNLQQQRLAAPPPPTLPPRPARIKAATPEKFDGTPAKAKGFISHCENYFILSPMSDKQQIRFALGLMEGNAEIWTRRQLQLLRRVPQPAHFATWTDFVNEFNTRFVDAQEQEKAFALLGKGCTNH